MTSPLHQYVSLPRGSNELLSCMLGRLQTVQDIDAGKSSVEMRRGHKDKPMTEPTLLPMTATLSSSKTRYGGRLNSLSLHCGGFSLGWLSAEGERRSDILSILTGGYVGRESGHSGSKHTMDPKYSWSGYNLNEEQADRFMKALFGTSVVDEVNRVLNGKEWVLFKGQYCLPREHLTRFIASRCRDRTWCGAVRLKEAPAALLDYVRSLAKTADEDDFFGPVHTIKAPPAPSKERMRWRCDDCGREGFRESFKERTVPGLSGSTGLNCPHCDYRPTDAISGLLRGPTRGSVGRMPSSIMYPEA